MIQYALSPDGTAVAYTQLDGSLWYGLVDRRTPPRVLAPAGSQPHVHPSGDIFFRIALGSVLYSIHPDGTGMRAVPGNPGDAERALSPVSPNEQWSIRTSGTVSTFVAYPGNGGRPIALCEGCFAGWSADGKFFRIILSSVAGKNEVTGLILLRKSVLPSLPSEGVRTQADLMKIPGAQVVASLEASLAPDGASYAFVKQESRWNLYLISLPK